MKRILAIGGGGFMMENEPSPIDNYILQLTEKDKPRICFVSTASGDLPEHIDKFYAAFSSRRCAPSHLVFFREHGLNALPLHDFVKHLLNQNAIFVGGGNTRSALAVWREWGVDLVFREGLNSGILLAGMSAGAMCWFECGLTDSFWQTGYRPLPCLGFLSGGCGVHYNQDATRRSRVHAAIEARAVPESMTIDDYAAVLFSGGSVERVVSWREGSTAYRIVLEGGRAKEAAYPCEQIETDASSQSHCT